MKTYMVQSYRQTMMVVNIQKTTSVIVSHKDLGITEPIAIGTLNFLRNKTYYVKFFHEKFHLRSKMVTKCVFFCSFIM